MSRAYGGTTKEDRGTDRMMLSSRSASETATREHCPQCAYRIDYLTEIDRCPECGLGLGVDFVALRPKRVYLYADRVQPYLVGLAAALGWWNLSPVDDLVRFCVLGLGSVGMTIFVVHRFVRFHRFAHRTEFMILNQTCIHWRVHGRKDVSLPWGDVEHIRVIAWFDWVILRLSSSPRTRYIPARFRPQGVSIFEFGRVIEQYRDRHGD